VFITARSIDFGNKTAAEIIAELPSNISVQVKALQLDVLSASSVHAMAQELAQQADHLDVLVNNAGYATKGSNLDEEIATTTLETNYYGLVRVTEALLPLLQKVPSAKIVNVSSRAGQISGRDSLGSQEEKFKNIDNTWTKATIDELGRGFIKAVAENQVTERGWPKNSYRVSKILVNAYTQVLARELQSTGITVNGTILQVCLISV